MNTIPKILGALAGLALCWAAAPVQSAEGTAALRAAVATERARAPAPRLPRTAFLDPPALQSVRLSPDGRHVAYLREHGMNRSLWLLSTAGGPARRLMARIAANEVHWSHDGRWLFAEGRRSLATVPLRGGGGVRIPLRGPDERQPVQIDQSQAAALVLRERMRTAAGPGWRLVRMDARGRRTVLHEGPHWVHDAAFDTRGRLVALTGFDGRHNVVYRVDPAGRLHQVRRLAAMERADLLGSTGQGELLLRGDIGGNFRRVLRLDRNNVLHTLHADPRGEADLDDVQLDPASGEPLIASYRSTVAATHGFGAAQAHVAAIQRQLPGRDLGIEVGSGTAAQWLVSERASTLRAPRWHLYDPRTRRLRPLPAPGATAPASTEAALARQIPFTYRASDGMRVRGFLWLPPGADPARVPLIAQVHGGPINHFRAGYDAIAQLLANRGYAVFQSNFRGSTGHGLDYMFASRGDYGNGRVQQDIVEGVRYLLAQGVGDADRVGIVGHSFGGYSTLLGVTFQPELFKVGVAGAPPADFAWSMRWLLQAGDQGAREDRSLKQQLRALQVDPTDPATYARLHSQSPVVNATRMRRPLLLLAGGADRVVAIREVVHYAAVLRRLDKDVSLYVEPEGGHSPTDPLPREAYVYLMEAMLHRHLRGAAAEPPTPALRDYLRRTLRVDGAGLLAGSAAATTQP